MTFKRRYICPTLVATVVESETGFAGSITGNIPSAGDDGFEETVE